MPGAYDADRAKRHTELRPPQSATAEQLKEAIQSLIRSGYTIEEIAARIKQPVSYVEGLLK